MEFCHKAQTDIDILQESPFLISVEVLFFFSNWNVHIAMNSVIYQQQGGWV